MRREYKGIKINSSINTHESVLNISGANDVLGNELTLDIPCGHGAFSKRLIENNIKVISSDIDSEIFKIDNIFKQSNMNNTLPFEDNQFGVVFCIDGISHTENISFTLREFNRVLKKGGSLVISTPNISALRSRFRWLLTGFHNKRKIPLNETEISPEHIINIIDYPMLRYFLIKSGFKIEKVSTNRVKFISWIYTLIMPLSYLCTTLALRKEKCKSQRKTNKLIRKHLFSLAVLFGETLIIKAHKMN